MLLGQSLCRRSFCIDHLSPLSLPDQVTPFLGPSSSPYLVGEVVGARPKPLEQVLVKDGKDPMTRCYCTL